MTYSYSVAGTPPLAGKSGVHTFVTRPSGSRVALVVAPAASVTDVGVPRKSRLVSVVWPSAFVIVICSTGPPSAGVYAVLVVRPVVSDAFTNTVAAVIRPVASQACTVRFHRSGPPVAVTAFSVRVSSPGPSSTPSVSPS